MKRREGALTWLLTVAEASKRLGVSERTFRTWAAAGRIALVRLSPRCIRVQPEELDRFIVERRVEAEPRRGGQS